MSEIITELKVEPLFPPKPGRLWVNTAEGFTGIAVEYAGKYKTLFADGSGSIRDTLNEHWRNLPKGTKVTLTLES